MKLTKFWQQFGTWSAFDFTLSLLAAAIIIPASVVLNNSVLYCLFGVLIVPCTILAYKKTVLGFCSLAALLVAYCFVLSPLGMNGSLIVVAGLILPILVYKVVKLFVHKLDRPEKTGTIELVLLCVLLAACAYPIYLLMESVFSGFSVIETILIIVGVLALFLEIRGCRLTIFVYPCLTILEFVIFVMFILDLHLAVIPLFIGILLALFVQIFKTAKLLCGKKERPAENLEEKAQEK